jgi:hypothetical protein
VLETGKDQFGKDLAWQPRLCAVWVHRTVSGAPGWLWRTGCSRDFVGGVRLKFTGLSGELTVGRANGRPRNPRATRGSQRSEGGTGLSGVHRTVSGAPTALDLQRSAAPKQERNPHRTVRCARRQKERIAFLECSQRLLAALGL